MLTFQPTQPTLTICLFTHTHHTLPLHPCPCPSRWPPMPITPPLHLNYPTRSPIPTPLFTPPYPVPPFVHPRLPPRPFSSHAWAAVFVGRAGTALIIHGGTGGAPLSRRVKHTSWRPIRHLLYLVFKSAGKGKQSERLR